MEANLPVPKATTTVFGKVVLCTAPANPANPIVVGCNDPRLGSSTVTLHTSQVGIVAGIVQTQAGATQLTKWRNIISTVTTAGDGIKAAQATENMEQLYKNEGANWFWFYPTLGDNWIGLAANVPIKIMPNNSGTIYCYEGEAGTLRYR